jgi:uncharacterized protein
MVIFGSRKTLLKKSIACIRQYHAVASPCCILLARGEPPQLTELTGDERLQLYHLDELTHKDSENTRTLTEVEPTEEKPQRSDAPDPEPGPKRNSGLRSLFRQYFMEPFVGSTNPPWFDARGIAVGLAVGFGAPIGIQTVLMGLLRTIFRYNIVIAFAFSWVNNPITMIPMYYGYYYVGSLILGRPVAVTGETFRHLMMPIVHASHFWDAIHLFISLGWDILLCWAITSLILAVTSAILGYVIGLRMQQAHCRRKAEEMGLTYDKLLARLEQSVNRTNNQTP